MEPTESIRDLAGPLVAAAGHELWDVEVAGGIVRILVDRPAGPGAGPGIDLDSLAAASHAISAALDERDDLAPGGRYHLEVSSPGVERRLRTPQQYRCFVGSEVSVKLVAPVAGSRRLRGVLVDAADTGIRVLVPAGGTVAAAETQLTYDQIERTHTVLVWGPSGSQSGTQSPGTPGRHKPGRARAASRPRPLTGAATNPKDAP
ncbi:MAG TPA: hypothetical protein VG184_13580 [Acidimicrobiales bacterium]|nr:hypothetical protein [Acidimicrobiales bacterium]